MHGKLKKLKERINTNLHGQGIATHYHREICVEECKYIDAGSQQCNMSSDSLLQKQRS